MVVNCRLVDPVSFEPVSNVTNVFFDDRNTQVFSVRSGGATGILVKGQLEELCSTFRMEDQGPIMSVKLSPDQTLLAVQRSKTTVHFVPVIQTGPNGSLDCAKQFSQSSKSKTAIVQGFYWLSNSEIMFITCLGIEIYGVLGEKRTTKTVKQLNQSVGWSRYCPHTGILVIGSPSSPNSLQPFLVRQAGVITKLPKIDPQGHSPAAAAGQPATAKDIGVHRLYGNQVFISVIARGSGNETSVVSDASESDHVTIHLYKVTKDSVNRSHVFHTPFQGGGIALNEVDNLFLAHHQSSGTSACFDVALDGESDGHIAHHKPVGQPIAIAPESTETRTGNGSGYSSNWVMFSPDIVIDAKQGLMWRLKNSLDFSRLGRNGGIPLPRVVIFLLQREKAKMVLLDVLLDWCRHEETELKSIGDAFDLVNREYRSYLDTQVQTNLALSSSPFYTSNVSPLSASQSCLDFTQINNSTQVTPTAKVILDQSDLYSNLFVPLYDSAGLSGGKSEEGESVQVNRLVALLLEYSRSLEEQRIPVQHFLNEILIHLLVHNESWYQLHQLLQYRVISDSKPLACQLICLENVYPAATQLATDMLSRLRNSGEEICEILLSKGRVLSALHYADNRGLMHSDGLKARKFLEAASSLGDEGERRAVYYSTYTYFKEKNLLYRGCDNYIEIFNNMFPTVEQ